MSAPSPKPSLHSEGSELIYGFDELIYSRTDPRGVIVSGNDVFERLSGVPWRELIGSPHRVIRHPEMPKGFFHLFWSMLKSGEPAVGYVRNRNVNSGYYWVLAAAIPSEGGYFSVRMRPSTDLSGINFQYSDIENQNLLRTAEHDGMQRTRDRSRRRWPLRSTS